MNNLRNPECENSVFEPEPTFPKAKRTQSIKCGKSVNLGTVSAPLSLL